MFQRFCCVALMGMFGLILSGCGEGAKEPGGSSRPQATGVARISGSANTAPAATTTSPVSAATSRISATTPPLAFLSAAEFQGEHYKPADLDGDALVLKHFGVTSATVTLTRDASKVNFRAKARSAPERAYPVLDIRLEAQPPLPKLTYVPFPKEVVSTQDTFTTAMRIPSGSYRVQLRYISHTKMTDKESVRPHVEFYGVTFE